MAEALDIWASQKPPDCALLDSKVFEALRRQVVNERFLELPRSGFAMAFASNESMATAAAPRKCLC
jgi:hypothetical protein